MHRPPIGYDDETVMPSVQAQHFLQQLLDKLEVNNAKDHEMISLLEAFFRSVAELPRVHRTVGEEIVHDFQYFLQEPSEENKKKVQEKAVAFTALFHQ